MGYQLIAKIKRKAHLNICYNPKMKECQFIMKVVIDSVSLVKWPELNLINPFLGLNVHFK